MEEDGDGGWRGRVAQHPHSQQAAEVRVLSFLRHDLHVQRPSPAAARARGPAAADSAMDRVPVLIARVMPRAEPMRTVERALRAGEADVAAAQTHQIATRTLFNERSTPTRRARLAWSGRDGASRRRTAGRGGRAAYLAAREPPRCPYWTCRWSCGPGLGARRPREGWPRTPNPAPTSDLRLQAQLESCR